jgi:hypothetical protein
MLACSSSVIFEEMCRRALLFTWVISSCHEGFFGFLPLCTVHIYPNRILHRETRPQNPQTKISNSNFEKDKQKRIDTILVNQNITIKTITRVIHRKKNQRTRGFLVWIEDNIQSLEMKSTQIHHPHCIRIHQQSHKIHAGTLSLTLSSLHSHMEDEDGSGELVPVLYVSKNRIGIRSIFLHDPNSEENEGNLVEEKILMVGRHLDFHIVVNHPSTSRWNLQIQLHKSSQRLLLTDLSSVHGTWVCVERATPQVPLTFGKNDTKQGFTHCNGFHSPQPFWKRNQPLIL